MRIIIIILVMIFNLSKARFSLFIEKALDLFMS